MRGDASFEARHLARCMCKIREEKFISRYFIKKYLERLEKERYNLIKELEIWCSYLNRNITISEIPKLSIEEARKRVYLSGYTIQDFHLCGMTKFFKKNPEIPPPSTKYVTIFVMLLQAAVNDLTWAVGELNAYLSRE